MPKRISLNDNFFSEYTQVGCYWAGMLASDGNVRENTNEISLKLCEKDRSHLETFVRDVNYEGGIKVNTNSGAPYVSLSSKQWKIDLKNNFGVVPRKAHVLKPPPIDDEIMVFCYLIGYIDGDGSIFFDRTDNNRINLSIYGTWDMMKWIEGLFNEKFSRVSHYKLSSPTKDPRCETWRYKVAGERCERILHYLSDFDLPYLKRKWSKII